VDGEEGVTARPIATAPVNDPTPTSATAITA
jgi:hypothetical protein